MHIALEPFLLSLSILQAVDPELLSQIPLWLKIPVYLFGFGGFIQFLRWVNNFRKTTNEKEKQEHNKYIDLNDAEAEFREELRVEMKSLRKKLDDQSKQFEEQRSEHKEQVEHLEGKIDELTQWCREVSWGIKNQQWHVRRLFIRYNDYREEQGDDPLPRSEIEEFYSSKLEKALEKNPIRTGAVEQGNAE